MRAIGQPRFGIRFWFWAAWLAILIPFSVDHHLGLTFGDFHLRGQYSGAGLWVLLELILALRARSVGVFRELWERHENWFFAAMALPALWAVPNYSPNHRRGWFFLVWSLGTMIVVPWLARRVGERLGTRARWAFYAYYALQAVIISVDALVCIPTSGKWSIGTIMVYTSTVTGSMLCRPSAFYQEPGYFAATGALVLVLMGMEVFGKGPRARILALAPSMRNGLKLGLTLIACALLLCLSRLGWLLAIILAGWAMIGGIRGRRESVVSQNADTRSAYRWLYAIPIVLVLGVGVKYGPLIYSHLGKPLSSEDGSIGARTYGMEAAFKVFKEFPLTGVGPGNAGPYYGPKYLPPDHPWIPLLLKSPLSQSLYPELLSEWGLLGTLFFFLGFWILLRRMPRSVAIPVGLLFAVIYTATQTLPRFDLWFLVGWIVNAFLRPQSHPRR